MKSEIMTVAIYAPADEPLWQALKVFISGMQHQGLLNIALWDLGEIPPGTDRENALVQWINEAHIVLLLLSSNLFAMDMFDSISPSLLQRNSQGSARVLPILLRPVNRKETPWGRLAALPDNEKPVTTWHNRREEAYLNIADGIRRVARELQPRPLPMLQEDRQPLPMFGYTLLKTLTSHLGPISSVTFNPNGTLLASDSWDGTIIIWEVATGLERYRLQGHTPLVYSLAFSPDGGTLASGGADGRIWLWDISSMQCFMKLHKHQNVVSSVAFDPRGDRLISGSDDHTAIIWDVKTGSVRAQLPHAQAVLSVSWVQSRYVVTGGADHIVRLWNLGLVSDPVKGTSHRVLENKNHTGNVYSVAHCPHHSALIASGSADHTVGLWNLDARTSNAFEYKTLYKQNNIVSSVAFHRSFPLLASGSHDKTIKLCNPLRGGGECETLVGHTEAVLSVAFHPRFLLLASGSFDKTVRLWGRREKPAGKN